MRNILGAAVFLCAGAIAAAAQSVAPADAVKDLAPSGKLRAAINLVNTVIAQRDPTGGDPKGVSVDLARELAHRLGVPIEFVIFDGAGKEFHAASSDVWDIGFFAIDPVRDADVDYTAPYVVIEGGYMVRKDSPVQSIADADKAGTRIAVGRDSVYDLYLTRALKSAQLVRVSPADLNTVVDAFFNQKLEVAAFITIPLADYAKGNPSMRMVNGVFMDIDQAIATPKGRGEAGRRYLSAFVEEMKASGFVADALKRSGERDVAVAPAAKADACVPLTPSFRSDSSRVVMEKIGPNDSESPTGNTYFLMPHEFKYVIVHLNPTSSDVGTYVVKLIARYTDDTIYEPVVEAIVPKANGNYTWGPLSVMPPAVPRDKIADMFNVKVQENYALNPGAKGFSYTVSVDGCN
jgi:polar amino acid transport system substrate-binding protein